MLPAVGQMLLRAVRLRRQVTPAIGADHRVVGTTALRQLRGAQPKYLQATRHKAPDPASRAGRCPPLAKA